MKRLFCTVITSYDDTLESPMVIHSMSETLDHAEKEALEYLSTDCGFDNELPPILTNLDNFDTFTFEVIEILGKD